MSGGRHGRRRRRRSAEEVERDLLAAALELLGTEGYAGLSVEAVAERSGVAKTTIYRRYRNRADLATAAVAAFADPEADAAALPDEPRAALVEYLRRFRERMEAKGIGVLASMLDEREDPELLELHRERIIRPRAERALALLRAARERGELRRDASDADLELGLHMLVGSYFARHISGAPIPDDWAQRAVDLLWEGLRAPLRAAPSPSAQAPSPARR